LSNYPNNTKQKIKQFKDVVNIYIYIYIYMVAKVLLIIWSLKSSFDILLSLVKLFLKKLDKDILWAFTNILDAKCHVTIITRLLMLYD
jgi:hypothetical protein